MSPHPAVSVVIDSKGEVYYSDTSHIFRVVANVHTHQLWIDLQDNLHGEDLTYHHPPIEGSNWRHRIWKRSPTGQLSDRIPIRKGFRSDHRDLDHQRHSLDPQSLPRRQPTPPPPLPLRPQPIPLNTAISKTAPPCPKTTAGWGPNLRSSPPLAVHHKMQHLLKKLRHHKENETSVEENGPSQ